MALRARLAVAAVAALPALALPAPAWAHGLVGRKDLPIPEYVFGWAAAAVLVISFALLALLWRETRLEDEGRPLFRLPAWLDPVCGAAGVALFAVVVYSGLAGSQIPTNNLLPTFVYVLFWVCLVPLCVLLGDVFRPFNPWRAIGRAAGWTARHLLPGEPPAPLPYPQRLGRWPAVAGLVAFGWLELVSSEGDDPGTIAVLALVYAAAMLVGMALFGVETWTSRGDAFGVYFGFFARMAPLAAGGRELVVRRPLAGLSDVDWLPGTVVVLTTAIGITAFDGASEGELWTSVAPDIQRFFEDLGLSLNQALEAAFTVGLLAVIAIVTAIYFAGALGARRVDRERSVSATARLFAASLVPIALAYVVAHYFSLAAYQGQATAHLISDPLGEGDDLFGTAGATIDYSILSANDIWYVQVGALVVGHVAAVVVAHDRALAAYGRARAAIRSQYWMLAIMVGFTTLGLWLLSSSN